MKTAFTRFSNDRLKGNVLIDRLLQASASQEIKRDLDTPLALNCQLNFPASSYLTVHVAGTNGKGSVVTKVAKALELSGYRVGVYTSPHLFSFQERIAINGALISEADAERGLEKLFEIEARLGFRASFFELMTFLALDYFREKQVDVAVIETGLGGRYDATNVIYPILSVITSISREHTSILGEEIEQIAAEKAGIIKEKIPVVLGPKARCRSVYERAKEMDSPVVASKKISYFFDEENSAVAELALTQLTPYFTIAPEALKEGLSVRPPCRFERREDVIFDVAHNPEAIFCLLQALHTFFPVGRFRFLVGFSRDKEYDRCLEWIVQVATHIHLVQAESPRAATTQELLSAIKRNMCTCHSSVQEGIAQAHFEAQAHEEILVVCGSFYIMAEANSLLTTK
jgi:dihydrofolate synthase / folylpolyglutamate synthase